MQVIVQVRADAVRRSRPSGGESTVPPDVANAASELGSRAEPMHPGVIDPELSRFFVLEVPDRDAAEGAAARLQQIPSVESAYWKPPDEAP